MRAGEAECHQGELHPTAAQGDKEAQFRSAANGPAQGRTALTHARGWRAGVGDRHNTDRADIQRTRVGFGGTRDGCRVKAICEPLDLYLAELDDIDKVIVWLAVPVELVEIRDSCDTVLVDCRLQFCDALEAESSIDQAAQD